MEPVRRALALVQEAKTALVSFALDAHFVAELPKLRELPLTPEADATFADLASMEGLEDLMRAPLAADGRVDLPRRACVLGPPFDLLLVDGRRYRPSATGGQSDWELVDEGTGAAALVSQPIWLLEGLAESARTRTAACAESTTRSTPPPGLWSSAASPDAPSAPGSPPDHTRLTASARGSHRPGRGAAVGSDQPGRHRRIHARVERGRDY